MLGEIVMMNKHFKIMNILIFYIMNNLQKRYIYINELLN